MGKSKYLFLFLLFMISLTSCSSFEDIENNYSMLKKDNNEVYFAEQMTYKVDKERASHTASYLNSLQYEKADGLESKVESYLYFTEDNALAVLEDKCYIYSLENKSLYVSKETVKDSFREYYQKGAAESSVDTAFAVKDIYLNYPIHFKGNNDIFSAEEHKIFISMYGTATSSYLEVMPEYTAVIMESLKTVGLKEADSLPIKRTDYQIYLLESKIVLFFGNQQLMIADYGNHRFFQNTDISLSENLKEYIEELSCANSQYREEYLSASRSVWEWIN